MNGDALETFFKSVKRMTGTRRRRVVLALVLATAVARIAIVLLVNHRQPVTTSTPDDGYLQPALAILRDHAYLSGPGTGHPEWLRTPGYPLFVAGLLWVGRTTMLVVLIGQALLSSLTVGLTYVLARRLDMRHVPAFVAALILALDPYSTAIVAVIQTETLSAFTTTVVALAGVAVVRRPSSSRHWALLGLALVACTFVRPSTFYLPVLIGAVVLVAAVRRRARLAQLLRHAVAFVLPLLLLVAYCARNQAEFGGWSVSSAEAITNYWYRASWNVSQIRDLDWETDGRALMTKELVPSMTDAQAYEYRDGGRVPPQWKGTEGEYYQAAQSRAIEILLENPALTTRQVGRGFYSQVVNTGWVSAADLTHSGSLPALLDVLSRGWTYLFGLMWLLGIALALTRRADRARFAAPLLIVIYLLVVASGNQALAGARMRSPILPLLAILAVYGALEVRSKSVALRLHRPSKALADVGEVPRGRTRS